MPASKQPPAADGFHAFSNGPHWRYTNSANARLTTAITAIKPARRVRHCLALLKRRIKKRHIEILLSVALIRYHCCPITSNCKARSPLDAVPSRMPKVVAISVMSWSEVRVAVCLPSLFSLRSPTHCCCPACVIVRTETTMDAPPGVETDECSSQSKAGRGQGEGEKDRSLRKVGCRISHVGRGGLEHLCSTPLIVA